MMETILMGQFCENVIKVKKKLDMLPPIYIWTVFISIAYIENKQSGIENCWPNMLADDAFGLILFRVVL